MLPAQVFQTAQANPGNVTVPEFDEAGKRDERSDPLPLFDDLWFCLRYDFAHFRERLAAPHTSRDQASSKGFKSLD